MHQPIDDEIIPNSPPQRMNPLFRRLLAVLLREIAEAIAASAMNPVAAIVVRLLFGYRS